ncbi:pentatricopeptide repeat-containing protein At3g24000, mitochondrial isoform X1 [Spinacia oleracea]|uniref:Pentatricopeptide repeat-containing protein At3g24000, mitochondrial isoform X1 n=1 Tax=Spinacia oleracea TaxID=3562 RepID=A0A9R0IDU9_SPIOL|nr:pentatricopeptide repeat-containing protein At3g24000, mitochondrial isoform X1 [Spinacia oleracea]
MRRSTPFCLRKLSYNDLKGFISVRECHEHISTSFGTRAVCRLSTKPNVLECEEERLLDAFQTHDQDLLLKSSDSGTKNQRALVVERGLKRCMELGDIREGRIVHANVLASEFKDDTIILNNIIQMYVKCGNLDEARKCFNEMPYKDTFTWTSMIIAYTHNGRPEEGLSLFPKMLCLGFKPNKFTFSSLLKASNTIRSAKHGMHIHTLCIKYGCDSSVYVGTSLVDLYARCGLMNEAQSVFDGLVSKNEVSWNALMAGHARKERGEETLSLFQRMKREDFEPNDFTYSTVLNACANTGVLEQGKCIHAHVIKYGVKLIAFVGHTLLHMYAKCGSVEEAEKVFTRLMVRDVVSWNSLLTGYAQHGLVHRSLEQFDNMLKTGIQPNAVTFLCLLTSCSHAGFVKQGLYYFKMMKKTYGLDPKIEHYVTIVDLLGRAGKLDQALRFITDIPMDPVAEIWKCLLGACRMHRNMELGVYAAERVFELDPYDSGPYVILANMYALAGRRNDVAKVRKMMKDCRVRKEPACSWVEIGNSVHVFVADDDTHPQSKEIYEMWDCICAKIKGIGYVPDISHVLLFVEEHEREVKLQHHSEKLALAFACLNTPPKSTIRIKKNIRVCGDCHSAFKFASIVIEREIVVRDTNRFHHFQNGSCSCRDYW